MTEPGCRERHIEEPHATHAAHSSQRQQPHHYDNLDDISQNETRNIWAKKMRDTLRGLDFSVEYRKQGRPYVEADSDGNVTHTTPTKS